jgi:hypothetical protein
MKNSEDEEETKTVIASDSSSSNLQCYQMKLSTNKQNATGKLLKVVKIMFCKDPQMEIELHDSMNDVFEAKPIYSIKDLESEEEREAYFPRIYDKKNKDGTAIVFRLYSE